jgi:hypothetical protein
VTDWTTGGYNFVMDAATAITGVDDQYHPDNMALWTTGNGGLDTITASPDGGNFLVLDGDWYAAPVSQTINGLVPGGTYFVSFYWGAAEQNALNGYYDGATTQSLTVSLGSESQSTTPYNLASHAFSGWMAQTDTFTANSDSETLSFLADGSPSNPPFLLLDGVSIRHPDVSMNLPEGGQISMYLVLAVAACFGAIFVARRKRLGTSVK